MIARDAALPEFDVESVTPLVLWFSLLVAFVEAVKFYDLGIQAVKSHTVRGFIKHYRKFWWPGERAFHSISVMAHNMDGNYQIISVL